MMPIRETEQDREREAAILAKVAEVTGEEIKLMPLMYWVDGAAMRDGRITRYIEVKSRQITFRQFPGGLFLSVNKLLMARVLGAALDVKTDLVVEFLDGIWSCPIDSWNRQRGVFWWGRDREGDEDGPSVAFPWDVFTRLTKVQQP